MISLQHNSYSSWQANYQGTLLCRVTRVWSCEQNGMESRVNAAVPENQHEQVHNCYGSVGRRAQTTLVFFIFQRTGLPECRACSQKICMESRMNAAVQDGPNEFLPGPEAEIPVLDLHHKICMGSQVNALRQQHPRFSGTLLYEMPAGSGKRRLQYT